MSQVLLDLLTSQVRAVSLPQAALALGSPLDSARRAADRLTRQGLIRVHSAMVPLVTVLAEPLLVWSPGDHAPNLREVHRRCQPRWRQHLVRTNVFRATELARSRCAGLLATRPERAGELGHDLHVTGVYLGLLINRPDEARRWKHEDALSTSERDAFDGHIPDAILTEPELMVIEIVGRRYSPAKLAEQFRSYHHCPCRFY